MKHKFLLGAVAAATMVLSLNARAAIDLGPLDPVTPISYDQTLVENTPFSDVYTFSMAGAGSYLISSVLSVYSDGDGKIGSFAASLKEPNGNVNPLAYTDVLIADPVGYHFLATGLAYAATGTYTLTVSGVTGASPATYTLNIGVSAVPEPETLALMLAGLGVVGFAGLRRKTV